MSDRSIHKIRDRTKTKPPTNRVRAKGSSFPPCVSRHGSHCRRIPPVVKAPAAAEYVTGRTRRLRSFIITVLEKDKCAWAR